MPLGKKQQHNDLEDEKPNNEICEIESLTRMTINEEYVDVADVVHATQNDHVKGIYIFVSSCVLGLFYII